MSDCKHCDKPIEWSREYQSWVHPHSDLIICADLEATPKEKP